MTPLPEGAHVRADLDGAPFRCDVAVFDVDGVLVDVSGSFREVIRTTATSVQRLMGVADPWTPSKHDIALFKRVGGFNDDIDMSIAMAALGAGGQGDDVAAVASRVESAGGGLRGLRDVAPSLPRIDGGLTLRIFAELYYGPALYRRLFDEEPEHMREGVGFMERERSLVAADFPHRLRQAGSDGVAVVTGRSPIELEVALERIGWDAEALCSVVTGDMVRKPDPACLETVAAACAARTMVYVGDVRDDWELVRRYREESPGACPVRCILVGDDTEMTIYRELGADATVRRTEDVPPLLRAWGEAG